MKNPHDTDPSDPTFAETLDELGHCADRVRRADWFLEILLGYPAGAKVTIRIDALVGLGQRDTAVLEYPADDPNIQTLEEMVLRLREVALEDAEQLIRERGR